MTMPESSAPSLPVVSALFARARDRLVAVACGAYVIYAAFCSVLTGSPLSTAQLAGVGVCGVVFVLALAGKLRSFRMRVAAQLVVTLLSFYGAQHELASDNFSDQITHLLWVMVAFPSYVLLLGSRLGLVIGLLVIALMALLLLGAGPLTPDQTLAWMTGLFVVLTLLLTQYLIAGFIERYLSIHEQTSGELQAARLDALTGVAGRAALESELQRALDTARRTNSPLSVILADIDHFKQVNDVHGHGAGDDVLRAFAKRLRRNVGGAGMVGRWGGEEFMAVLPGVARDDALALAERLRQAVSDTEIAGLPVTASFGVAALRPDDDLNQLFSRADERLYDAKNGGRNTVR
ncbi:GGDEF domain-containing protein [Deinococcus radiodurans]|jgi:diguanylate cyclase (GGDEF) domain